MSPKNQRKQLVALGLAFLIIAALGVNKVINNGKIAIRINTVPNQTAVLIDDKRVRTGSGTIKLKPGKYTVTGTYQNFADKIVQLDTTKDKTITLNLVPLNQAGVQNLQDNSIDYLVAEAEAGAKYTKTTEDLLEQYAFLGEIPLIERDFRIDRGVSRLQQTTNPTETALYIQAISAEGRRDALALIKDKGYDISDYEVVFVNPLEEQ